MLKFQGFTVPRTLEEVVSPENTALLVYDMQDGIVRQIANGDEIVAQVRLILESARASACVQSLPVTCLCPRT